MLTADLALAMNSCLVAAVAAAEESVSDTSIALIGAGAGIVGAVVGGALSGFFTLRGEKRRQEFARETDAQQREYDQSERVRRARGAARHWRHLFHSAGDLYEDLVKQGRWWPVTLAPQLFPDIAERREVASLLTLEEWETVELAEAATQLLLVARPQSRDDEMPPLSAAHRKHIAQTVQLVRAGEKALARLSV